MIVQMNRTPLSCINERMTVVMGGLGWAPNDGHELIPHACDSIRNDYSGNQFNIDIPSCLAIRQR